jgi:ribosomal-protein-alanine N-acetyltransferase
LRRYRREDVELVHRVMSDPRAMRYYSQLYDLQRSRDMLDRMLAAYRTVGYSLLAVERKSDGRHVGHVGLLHWDDVDGREDVEVGYMLLPEFWGMGYATEAAQACRDWAFANLNVDRVVSFIATENEPSIAVAKRNGMRRSKRLEHTRFARPIYVYRITRRQWESLAAGRQGEHI